MGCLGPCYLTGGLVEREVSSTAVAFSRTGESGDDAEFGWEDVGAKSRRRTNLHAPLSLCWSAQENSVIY